MAVTKGIERLRQGLSTEALQLFNKALEVDPTNIDALVARGALYANTDCFALAVKDFEEALKLDSSHSNARKYLLETLMTQAKMLEKRGKRDRAAKLYRKVLNLDSEHQEAFQRLQKLSEKELFILFIMLIILFLFCISFFPLFLFNVIFVSVFCGIL
ncbi:unnamed protein product [Soboliphyme baturini]|uniref:TPR_REGION domain-containing protein n=1 Tax=Soboliphyme baturini TaxID=241478 RepID=A0A183IU42_9BILA|nr:unnamed protein product [Soboliphyme baturini]